LTDSVLRVIALGSSAGGLHALSVILAALPADFPAPVLVAQHLSPDFPSEMAHILGRHTALRVKQAEQGERLYAGWVYVAPPGKHLVACADGSLALTSTPRVHHCRPSADVLLKSVAASFGVRAVGVILTGGDGDGAAGIQAIKAAGGITMAQDLPSSRACLAVPPRRGPWTMCWPCPTSPPL
jgi:two-component system chemotaxis response regulator CheB